MPRGTDDYLGRRLAKLEAEIKKLQKGRLQNSSLHGSALPVYDDDDVLKAVMGRQPDGSHGVLVRNSPAQPTPTKLSLSAGELGAVECTWDGGTTDFDKPLVHGHLVVESCYAGEDGTTPGEWHTAGTIRDRDGGATTIVCSTPGVWMVRCYLVGQDRVTRGEASEVETVQVEALVDTAEIEEKLQEAERERQEYRDAFDERTAEYDARLDDAADALAAADAWSANAFYRADSAAADSAAARVEASEAAGVAQDAQSKYDAVSSRQDASEAEIEAARQEAAAAHEAAGEAHQYAASIADQVDGIGKTIRSTNPPSGTADEGDYWRQFDSMSRDRRLIGWWEYRDGAWDRLSLDVTVLPMAEIGQLVVDDARAQRIFAEVGEISRLAVGDFENLLPESMLWEYRELGLSSVSWQAISGGASGWTTITGRGQHPVRLRWEGSEYVSSTSRLAYGGRDGRGIPVKPGDQFRLSMVGWNGTSGLSVGVRYGADDLSFVARETAFNITSNSPSGSWVVPNNTAIRRMQIEFTGDSSAAGGNADFGDIEVRRALTGEMIVDGLLQADQGVIRELITETAVGQTALFELVRAGLIEADEALIGDVLLKDGAVTAPKLHVTEEMVAEFAQILHLVADQVDMNSFVADSGMIGVLEAIGIVLRDQGDGRSMELSGSGMLMTETDTGEPLMQLGLYGDDFFSLTNEEGEQSVVLQRNGLVAGEVVSSETDLLVGGRELVGTAMDHPGGRESSAVLDPFPRGILAQLERPFTEDSSTGQEISIGYLQARLQRGRLYRIKCNPFVMGHDTSGAEMLVYQTTGEDDWPVMPSSSTGWSRGAQRGMPTASGMPVLQYETLHRPETDQYFRCIFVIRRTAGSSMSFWPFSRGTAHMMIEDIGADANHTGRPMFRLSGNTPDVGTSESVSVTRTPTQGQTYQAFSVSSSSFTAVSPESRYRHGYWDADFVTRPTHYMAGFRFTDSTSQINGREVISAEWRVLVDAWALKTVGDSIYPGIRIGGGALPSSMDPSSVEWLDNVHGRLPGRWASIPVPDEHIQEVIDGSAQLVLGRPSMSRRGGAATPANGVQLVLRVTQT